MSEETKMSVTLAIQSRLDQVRLVRAALFGVLDHLRVVESDIMALELALTEIVNNCVEHGLGKKEDEEVQIRIDISGAEVVIEVIDHGEKFPESQQYRFVDELVEMPEPDEQWSLRGHGIQIVRQIVDSIAIRSDEDENVLTFTKKVMLKD